MFDWEFFVNPIKAFWFPLPLPLIWYLWWNRDKQKDVAIGITDKIRNYIGKYGAEWWKRVYKCDFLKHFHLLIWTLNTIWCNLIFVYTSNASLLAFAIKSTFCKNRGRENENIIGINIHNVSSSSSSSLPPVSRRLCTLHFMNSQYQMGDCILTCEREHNFTFQPKLYMMEFTFSPLRWCTHHHITTWYMLPFPHWERLHFHKCRIHYRLCCHILWQHSCIYVHCTPYVSIHRVCTTSIWDC